MRSKSEDIECRGVVVEETLAAYRIQKAPGFAAFWFPKSQISYCRKTRMDDGVVHITAQIPEWLIDTKDAWELVP